MKKLINDVKMVVPEALRGMVRLNPALALIEEYNIVVRADFNDPALRAQVALVSGGGAGHEPAHAGYVGRGMLTAAVAGDVFTSPSTEAVLAAIRTVARPAGVLLIVKNYTGDRLNFGLAAEIARAEGIAVEMVVVADDMALDANGDHAGRRGIAGTVLVHKVAGAAAAAGLSLEDVKQAALRAIRNVGTMGVGLTACTVPAAGRPGFSLADHEIELGLGIHGEAGVSREPMAEAASLAEKLVGTVAEGLGLSANERVALLVNNLGATPTIEMQLFAGNVLASLERRNVRVERVWCGTFLTALEMAGVSVTLLRIGSEEELQALDAPAQAMGWPAAWQGMPGTGRRISMPAGGGIRAFAAGPVPDAVLAKVLEAICAALSGAEEELTRLDQIVGDGDLGLSLARGATAVRTERGGYPWTTPAQTLRALSGTVGRALGGTSGPLYAILLMRAAASIERADIKLLRTWGEALAAGCAGIAEVGGAKEGDCTMLDALLPASRVLMQAAPDADPHAVCRRALDAAREGAAATAQMVARRGRASYLGTRAIGHQDPGALAACIWLEASMKALEVI